MTTNNTTMNKDELLELSETLRGIAEGKEWEFLQRDGAWVPRNEKVDPLGMIRVGGKIRLKLWKLPDPPEGQRWHKESYWNEGTLPTGYRPLLLGEKRQSGDEFQFGDEWLTVAEAHGGEVIRDGPHIGYSPHRTKRPLPQPDPVLVKLENVDVPPMSAFRHPAWNHGIHITPSLVTERGVCWLRKDLIANGCSTEHLEFDSLKEYGWLINRSIPILGRWDSTAWEPCHKESQP